MHMEARKKRICNSRTEQVQILTPAMLNGVGRLFGGQLMQWIDVVAGVVARRHSGCIVTTASVDSLQFTGPAYIDDMVVLVGALTYVGTSSMEVCVKTYVEALAGERTLINTAYMVMVALDENERPTEVPRLVLETDDERNEWERGLRRNALRKQRRKEAY